MLTPRGPLPGRLDRWRVPSLLLFTVPFPVSRSRVDKLGKQLAEEGIVRADQLEIYSLVLGYYEQLLDTVAKRVSICGYAPTARVKTTGTLIEKLRREHGIQLSRIQDVAGMRIVVGGLRAEQDQAVSKILSEFKDLERVPSVVDRRVDPRHGYRAVHLIVYPEGVPVEIQIRTSLQDLWAQIFENVADQWGRQIRYGGAPNPPSMFDKKINRVEVMRLLALLSEGIATYENLIEVLNQIDRDFSRLLLQDKIPRIEELKKLREKYGLTPDIRTAIKEAYDGLRVVMVSFCCNFEPDRRRRGRIIRRRFPKRENPEIGECETAAKWLFLIVAKLVVERRSIAARQGDRLRGILEALARMVNNEVV